LEGREPDGLSLPPDRHVNGQSPVSTGIFTRLPNLICPIDLRGGEPTVPSLFALSEARRVATAAGATVFALAFSEQPLPDAVASRLGRAGADKVIVCEGPGLSAPPLDATHGGALAAAIDRIPPLMVLFPAGGAGAELGPALAARLGAAFAGEADLELSTAPTALADGVGRVCLRRWRRDRSSYRRLDPVELERPVVGLLPAFGPPADKGGAEVEVEIIACPPPRAPAVVTLDDELDDQAAVTTSAVLVVVDPALAPLGAQLAAAAPAGVVVVEASPSAPALAAAAPRLLLAIGAPAPLPTGTPRGRLGLIVPPGGPAAARPGADVVWRPAAKGWAEALAADLGALAGSEPPAGTGARR
jgi:hypothetical protein